MKSLITVITLALALTATAALASTELAKVDGTVITDTDLKASMQQFNEGQREALLKDANTRRQLVGQLIGQEVMIKEAEKEKIDQEPEFKEALNRFRRSFMIQRLLAKYLSSRLNESAAKKYYEAHKDRFSTAQVHAQHILLETEEQAKEILKKAKDPTADFQVLAEKYSKDPSAKSNRGDMGFFGRDRMVTAFTDPAFAASPGDIIGPIKTDYGYHIIKIIDKRDGKAMGFDEVELQVKNELRMELTRSYVDKLRTQAKVTVDDKAIEKL